MQTLRPVTILSPGVSSHSPQKYQQCILDNAQSVLKDVTHFLLHPGTFLLHLGTMFYQKHAVCFEISTSLQCPLCHHSDSALLVHILSGRQHQTISSIITERHNIACRLIIKATEVGSLGGCFVQMDIGSKDRLALQNAQIPE